MDVVELILLVVIWWYLARFFEKLMEKKDGPESPKQD